MLMHFTHGLVNQVHFNDFINKISNTNAQDLTKVCSLYKLTGVHTIYVCIEYMLRRVHEKQVGIKYLSGCSSAIISRCLVAGNLSTYITRRKQSCNLWKGGGSLRYPISNSDTSIDIYLRFLGLQFSVPGNFLIQCWIFRNNANNFKWPKNQNKLQSRFFTIKFLLVFVIKSVDISYLG